MTGDDRKTETKNIVVRSLRPYIGYGLEKAREGDRERMEGEREIYREGESTVDTVLTAIPNTSFLKCCRYIWPCQTYHAFCLQFRLTLLVLSDISSGLFW